MSTFWKLPKALGSDMGVLLASSTLSHSPFLWKVPIELGSDMGVLVCNLTLSNAIFSKDPKELGSVIPGDDAVGEI